MAGSHSPYTISEPSNQSPSHSTATSRKRKRPSVQRQQQQEPEQQAGPRSHEYGFMRDTGEKDAARFVGSSTGIHFIRNVHIRLARRSADRAQNDPLALRSDGISQLGGLVPGEDDQLKQRAAMRGSENTQLWKETEISLGDETTPSFDQLVAWSRSYFESWHPILPFLSGPDVLRIFEDVSKGGIVSLHYLDRAVLRSVLSISLADSRQATPLGERIPSPFLFQTLDEAITSSQFALCQPASIRATQAVLSVQLFLISMLCLNAASRLGGLIVRMALHLGLHRCPKRYPFFSPKEALRRRRIFWSIYCCERFLSQALGLPFDLRDDDVDVCFPGEEQHGTGISDDEDDKRISMLTYMAKHARIRGLIMQLRNKSMHVRQDTAERVVAVQAELARWSNEIQDAVEDSDDIDPGLSSSHRLVLLLSKYESIISLNRPIMASDPSSPQSSAAMQACISAAKSICIAMKQHTAKSKMPTLNQEPVPPPVWPAFISATWISAFVLGYAAVEQQMPLESALRHIESSKEALHLIAARGTLWPEYCQSAVDELITTVRELSLTGETGPDFSENGNTSRSRGQEPTTSPTPASNPEPASPPEPPGAHGLPPVVISSGGLVQGYPSHGDMGLALQRKIPPWPQNMPATSRERNQRQSSPYEVPHTSWGNSPQASRPTDDQLPADLQLDRTDMEVTTMPGEGQESMVWYDQFFESSFGAIDNPFLATAQFDSFGDAT